MHCVESEDGYYEKRISGGSLSCLFPPLICMDSRPRKSVSYNRLYQDPLSLTIVKLDASSFGIEVAKTGTVGELKRAVETSFCHLPKKGTGRVSWKHVWGQFCLCHEGRKLLNDSDYIAGFRIKDGDQLHFVHHSSTTYNKARTKSERENLDSDDEPSISNVYSDKQQDDQKDDSYCIEVSEKNQDDDLEPDDVSFCEYKVTHFLRRWLPYRKFTSSQKTNDEKSSSLKLSYSKLGSFKNILRVYRNKNDSWTKTEKGE